MAEAELSKIVGLIMENPELIEKIKNLMSEGDKKDYDEIEPVSQTEVKVAEPEPEKKHRSDTSEAKRRHELLCALKPYVSKDRQRAIDTMLSFSDVLQVFKEK